jgi:glycosyltransferase involved in cell wall biosynthesis
MSPSAVCLICAEFISPSVRHVPCLLPVHGVACAGALIDRLRAFFGDRCAYVLLCAARGEVADALAAEAVRRSATFFGAATASLGGALAEWCRNTPSAGAALVFPATAIVPNCALASDMLEAHLSRGAEPAVTIAPDVPLGLAPVLVMSPSAGDWLGHTASRATSCAELAMLLAMSVKTANGATGHDLSGKGTGPLVYRLRDAIPGGQESLPAAGLIADEPTRVAAEAALAQHPRDDGWSAAKTFKWAAVAALAHPRAVRRAPPAPRCEGGARRVLFSSMQLAFSGGEESLGTLITHLDRDRFAPVAVFPFDTMLAGKLDRRGVAIEIAGWDYTPLNPVNLRYCEALLDEQRPSIVHVDGVPNPALMAVAHLRGIPIVGHLRMLAGPVLPPAAHLADRIIAVSDAVARDARRDTIDPHRIVRIYNGVGPALVAMDRDERDAIRRDRGIPADARVITMVARIGPSKRLDLLVDALPAIVRALPAAHVVFAGEAAADSREYVAALRGAIAAAGLDSRVTWWGFEPAIGRVYAVTDLLVHANRHEPLARCMIESLVCGVPIVGPRDGGTPEVIDDGSNGLLYEPDSAAALADAVIAVLGDEPRLGRMRSAARLKAAEFSVSRHVVEVQALYEQLLGERAAASALAASHAPGAAS